MADNASVIIKGLPANYTEDSLRALINEPIDRDERGRWTISLFQPKAGAQFKSARVTFINAASAARFIKTHDKRPPPGEKNRLSVELYKDRGQNRQQNDNTAFVLDIHSVHITGLPENVSEVNLYAFFSSRTSEIGKYPTQTNKVHVLKRQNGKAVAKITYTSANGASSCIREHNGKLFRGMQDCRMKITLFKEKEQHNAPKSDPLVIEKHSDRPKTIIRNVVYVQGLPKNVTEGQIINSFEICGTVKKVKLYKYEDGKGQGRGVVSFENNATAQRCIQLFNGTRYPGINVAMAISLFESTKIRRLPGARGNTELFLNNAPAHAQSCITCFEMWDERDMIGCVPVERTHTDTETHFICQECARRHAASLTTDGEVGTGGAGLPCGMGDKRVIMWGTLKKSLADQNVIRLLEKRLTARALQGVKIDGQYEIEFCKFCDFGYVPAQDKIHLQFFSCQTTTCKAQFCRVCMVDFAEHAGKNCDDVDPVRKQERARKAFEDALSAAVIRICPTCNTQFQKLDGCNKMVCDTCKTTMCYLCRATGITYDHFNGGICQTHASSDEYDRNQLNKVREQGRMNQLTRELADVL